MQLKDKSVLVTGASSGIGKAIAIALAKEGAIVAFTYNSNEKGAEETLKEIGKNGMKFKVDMENENEIKNLFSGIKTKFNKLDILVNNAGVNRPRGLFDPND